MKWKGLHTGSVECLDRLWEAGYAAYPVGGCVRDSLLGLVPHDWGPCTSAAPEEMALVVDGEVLWGKEFTLRLAGRQVNFFYPAGLSW